MRNVQGQGKGFLSLCPGPPSTVFFCDGSVSKHHKAPAGIWSASPVAGTTMYPATRTTMIDRREKWSLSELCATRNVYTRLNTLEKSHWIRMIHGLQRIHWLGCPAQTEKDDSFHSDQTPMMVRMMRRMITTSAMSMMRG